jgi:hypothetical protein
MENTCRWEQNIKIDVKMVGECGQESSGSGKNGGMPLSK